MGSGFGEHTEVVAGTAANTGDAAFANGNETVKATGVATGFGAAETVKAGARIGAESGRTAFWKL